MSNAYLTRRLTQSRIDEILKSLDGVLTWGNISNDERFALTEAANTIGQVKHGKGEGK